MSKHPSPRADQLRAMREAKFAKNEQRQREADKPAPVAKTAESKSSRKKKTGR